MIRLMRFMSVFLWDKSLHNTIQNCVYLNIRPYNYYVIVSRSIPHHSYIRPSLCLNVIIPIQQSICSSLHLCICACLHPCIESPVHLHIDAPVQDLHPCIYLSIHVRTLSIHARSQHLSRPFINKSIHSSTSLSLYICTSSPLPSRALRVSLSNSSVRPPYHPSDCPSVLLSIHWCTAFTSVSVVHLWQQFQKLSALNCTRSILAGVHSETSP